jgi:hypothetical protein
VIEVRIVLTRQEIADCLPRAGRYLARIEAVSSIPPERPLEIDLLLRVIPPPPLPTVIHDRFRIRGDPRESLAGMHCLLRLLHLAGVRVVPETPLDLDALLGLTVLVDVRREPGPAGFPFATVVGYDKPWMPWRGAMPAAQVDRSCARELEAPPEAGRA